MVEGTDYRLSRMDVVCFVDENYPHAEVGRDGGWSAEPEPAYGPPVGPASRPGPVAVFSSDRAYYPGLIVALLSFRRHHPETHVVVLDCGLSPRQVDYLRGYAEVLPSANHLPDVPAWARFEVSLLPYERVIYLDSDIVVLRRLDDFLDSTAEFAAVRNLDWKVTENFRDPSVLDRYGIPRDLPAFFAGGFSIDNRVWGRGRLLEEANRVYREAGPTFLYADQSALQLIMHSRRCVTLVDDAYNAIAEFWDWRGRSDEARVIHYAGDEIKPWDPRCCYPGLDHFFAYSKIVRDGPLGGAGP